MTASNATPAIAATLTMVRNCILVLKANCDGASSIDGAGFSKFDTQAGRDFAERIQANKHFTAKQYAYMGALCVKYRRQLQSVSGFNEAAVKALVKELRDGTTDTLTVIKALQTPVATSPDANTNSVPAPAPNGNDFVESQGVFERYSNSGMAMLIKFGGRKEWIPCSVVHPDDKMQQGVETVFRVKRWTAETKDLPLPRKVPAANSAPAPASARVVVTHVIE